ncbi:MAG: UDP-4-amino-4-deoxy-L-arabinose--oxoglutarate aminotransferase (EC [uncultured Sulfurovum sp.]|uniref:UDP-4-amino-4-deoxy-L-arabinose--oxoglutarate aminotransferase (EC) n=1 Tax=uncultured Sulfurovum sp. TaxID=269237 RepID=A0A6S6SRU1_9BACT|nr:MAG: UDP-4-amino-4-deoxy-L-arabinose--oxoglutarate aminotransferase (EC [uncultured Sulfurovum sp.]
MIPISKVWYPNKNNFLTYIDKVYETGWLTNNGPLVQELEERLEKYLGVKNLLCVASGSSALEMAYSLLELKDEVISTPFTFVATTDTILEQGLTPVYADIHKDYLTLDPTKIEASITPKTTAIVPVHVFGNACQVDEILEVANEHNLKVVFDASHAFAVNYKGQSILNYGDISTLSFNAVKLFHSVEGGAIIIKDDALYEKAKAMRQYGTTSLDGSDSFAGLNTKMNELEAAMGLAVLDEITPVMDERKKSYLYYKEHLYDVVQMLRENEDANFNYSYCPLIFNSIEEMNAVQTALMENGIKPRRYFAPSLDQLSYVEKRDTMHISQEVTSKILALPLHSDAEKIAVPVILEALQAFRSENR